MFQYLKKKYLIFSSLIGYIAIIVFLLATGCFFGYFRVATTCAKLRLCHIRRLVRFSALGIYVLIPAITMRSFSEEIKSGTLEILTTRPLSEIQIILGKYLPPCFGSILTTANGGVLHHGLSAWYCKSNIDSGV